MSEFRRVMEAASFLRREAEYLAAAKAPSPVRAAACINSIQVLLLASSMLEKELSFAIDVEALQDATAFHKEFLAAAMAVVERRRAGC